MLSPPDSGFTIFFLVAISCSVFLPFAFALSVTGTHAHRQRSSHNSRVRVQGDHWTVFVQNASICQTWLIELRPQPETAHCSAPSSTELLCAHRRNTHFYACSDIYSIYIYAHIHMQRHTHMQGLLGAFSKKNYLT